MPRKIVQTPLFEDTAPPEKHPELCCVLIPMPVDKAYDYGLVKDMRLEPGAYVIVPVGSRTLPGVIWGAAQGGIPAKKLKEIISTHDLPPMPAAHRDFIDWVAAYTMSPRGSILKMALSVPAALERPKPVKAYTLPSPLIPLPSGRGKTEQSEVRERVIKLTPKQKHIFEILKDGRARRPSEIAQEASVSAAIVTGMAKKGLLEMVELYNAAPCRSPDPDLPGPVLSEDQRAVADTLRSYLSPSPLIPLPSGRGKGAQRQGEGTFKPILLDGVTGAGKTEVYFEAVAQALRNDKQVLILLPEIALSNAFIDRFKSRFGCAPALWHSNLTPAQRRTTWRGVAEGSTKLVVGARSALFLPFADLGFIVVDEEHDPAYKQEEGVIYHARDMAVVRAHQGGFPILLVSATPSLETIHNAWEGRYEHLHLPDRFGGARLPDIETIDLREDKPESQHFIAPRLKAAMVETLTKGEQVLLFLNRRGYAPLTLCRSCGHRMNCPRCTAWLVEHKKSGRMQCHHCGFSQSLLKICPECESADSFAACGPGVERIQEEVRAYFPDSRILVLASDTAENDAQLRAMLDEIRDGRVDIIIGTQIIAKGHHFPNLTCVGVIDADLGLQGGELRAAERTYQLLHQVAGRAGREERKGHVYLQTFMPDHPIMQALAGGERNSFLEAEAAARQAAHMPPYGRLAGIIVSGRDQYAVETFAKTLGRSAPQGKGIRTLGPAPAPFAMLRGRHRQRLLVQAEKNIALQKAIANWLSAHKIPSSVRVQIDIDPQSFL